MKVKLMVAAVAAAFAAPLASADVTISGTFAPLLGHQNYGTSQTVNSPITVGGTSVGTISGSQGYSSIFFNDAASRLTIESNEDLGNGMGAGAFLQIRGTNGTFDDFNGENKGLTPFRWGVNVNGGWGKLLLGREFTPYTWTMINNETNMGAIWFGPFNIMGHAGGQGLSLTGGPGSTQHAFFKVGTGAHYYSPDINGFSFKASWVTDNAKGANNQKDLTELGLSADWKPADLPFWLGAAYSNRRGADGVGPMNDLFAGTARAVGQTTGLVDSTDTVFLLGGGVAFGDLTVGVWWDRVKYKTNGLSTAGNLSELRRDALWIPVGYALPSGKLGFSYTMALDSKGKVVGGDFESSNTGAYSIQASYAHNLSKQTQPFIMFSYTDADNRSAFNGPFGNNGQGVGGKTTMMVLGLQHSF
jgi:hypothetical protein